MASMPPQEPGPSSGVRSPYVPSESFDEVDVSLLVGEGELPHLKELLQLNKLKLVPCDWSVGKSGNNEECKSLREQVRKLQATLSERERELEDASVKVAESETASVSLENMVKQMLETEEGNKEEIAMLKRKLEESEERGEKLQMNSANQQNFLDDMMQQSQKIVQENEKTVKIVQSQLKQAKNRLAAEVTSNEKLLEEKENVEKELDEEKARMERKIQEEKTTLMKTFQDQKSLLEKRAKEVLAGVLNKFQEEKVELERKSEEERNARAKQFQEDRVRRGNEIIALKDENERFKGNQFKFIVFIRQLMERSGLPVENEIDVFSPDLQEKLSAQVQKLAEKNNEDTEELVEKRLMLKQIEDIFIKSRCGERSSAAAADTTNQTNGNNVQFEVAVDNATTNPNDPIPSRSESLTSVTPPASPPQILITSIFTQGIPPAADLSSEDISYSIVKIRADSPPPPPDAQPNDPAIPKMEVDADDAPMPAQGPSIVIPLSTVPTSSSLLPPQTPQQGEQRRGVKRSRRNSKQFTPYTAASNKPHKPNKASSRFQCVCRKVYQYEKGLNEHIRKNTTAWQYPCRECKQYFFYKSDLKRHVEANKCSENLAQTTPGGNNRIVNNNNTTNGEENQPPPPAVNSTSAAMTASGFKKRNSLRKLQQEILKRKTHAPWLSKQGTVQGSWYCKCASKFSSKANLLHHVHYFTYEWKFKCELCPQKFFYLSQLKKHMVDSHKIKDPLKEYSVGCYLCGEKFFKRKQYYQHRKLVHNLHQCPSRQNVKEKTQSSKSVATRTTSQSQPSQEAPSTSGAPPLPSTADITEIVDVPSADDDCDEEISVLPSQPTASPSTRSDDSRLRKLRLHFPVVRDPLTQNSNEQAHQCKCRKEYTSRSALMRHIRVEVYGNLVSCLRCFKTFKDLSGLNDHTTKVHGKDLHGFKCALCNQAMPSGAEFKSHILEKHNLKENNGSSSQSQVTAKVLCSQKKIKL